MIGARGGGPSFSSLSGMGVGSCFMVVFRSMADSCLMDSCARAAARIAARSSACFLSWDYVQNYVASLTKNVSHMKNE